VLHEDGSRFETDGPGLSFVDIYTSSGGLLQRLDHGDWLNAPWGVALAPLDFGRFSHDLLIGQFAGVSPANNDAAGAPAAEIYFTAGPNHGSGGLFGYLTAVSTELTEGNSQ
jgi:hypothetical protein